jgi:hypothetical protein
MKALAIAMLLGAACAVASAQPGAAPADASTVLREANAAATAGEWPRVAELVGPLVDPLRAGSLERADQAEAQRLAGLAAYFAQRTADAEAHFLAYLRIDSDGHLDPALYPPEVVVFFDDVRARHAAELRTKRPRAKRHWYIALLPPFAQFQNGERTKAWVTASALGAFTVANVGSYLVLRSWCTRVSTPGGTSSLVCDEGGNHAQGARTLRTVNVVSGIGLIVTYVWGVYDGVRHYRRNDRTPSLAPYTAASSTSFVVGIGAQW